MATHQWMADATNDMYADAVLSVILQVSSQPKRFGGYSLTTPLLITFNNL